MLEDKRITKKPNLTTLIKIRNTFSINSSQEIKLIQFLKELAIHNKTHKFGRKIHTCKSLAQPYFGLHSGFSIY